MTKIDVRTLYDVDSWYWDNYQPILNAFGNIVLQVDDTGWNGDSRVLYDNDGTFGYLIFGWGSCSACDALRACEDLDDVQNLCDQLQDMIKWLGTKEEALAYFRTHDLEGDYVWYDEEGREFVNKAIEYLKEK